MSTKVPQNNDDQEIDLVQISKKIGNFFDGINRSIFRGIQFFVRNWVIVLLLFIVGFGVGLFLDKTQKQFDNKIIVEPNFGSVDYLYSKIDLIQSKIQTNDTEFFKAIGISNVPKISKISIEPIVDVFKFVNNNEQNLEVLKLMTANGDLKSIINETTTVKNYPFYIISFSTDGLLRDQSTATALLNYINTSKYYSEVQKIRLNNIQQRIKENDEVVAQIDGILNKFSSSESTGNQKNDKLVYYNENTQLNDIIKTKDGLLRENAGLKLELVNSDKIVKESSIATNIVKTESLKGKLKFVLPFLLILIYLFTLRFMSFYKRHSAFDKINKS
ncbi:hypothetical protein [Flavobacterium aquicola]|uniref:Subunit length determinant protein n=1 Tax=Flavobacterium aquicola TaxID=1682742 RepID=A0A3E0EKZ8_9FLAO|nr:hypothetical protein [Flavobacterium aquicola]REG98924.1 hypothetical protein C8P67_10586 [Flavobacterium aquicola]